MTEATLYSISVKLDGNAALQTAHEKLDDTRFETVCQTMTRVEAAIVDHAKASADTLDKMNVRTHARMDQVVASISKLTDYVGTVKDDVHELKTSMIRGDSAVKEDLNNRISSTRDWIMGGAIAMGLPLMAWMALQIYEGLK